ncbi:MAG: hypothetical protein QOG87_2985 [Actinomycetota bacterium]|jgi:hypothetical protein
MSVGYGDTAGGSAAGEGARLRAIAGAETTAAAWERGAVGERQTAELLSQLPASFHVMHDRSLPGSRANVDHLVVGPPGVFMVDSKNFTYPVTLSNGTLWTGTHPLTRELEKASWEARSAGGELALHRGGRTVPITPVLCIHGSEIPDGLVVGGVIVVGASRLVHTLLARPRLIADAAVADLAALAASALREWMPPPEEPAHVSSSPSTRTPKVASTKRRTSNKRPITPPKRKQARTRRSGRSEVRRLVTAAAVIVFSVTLLPDVLQRVIGQGSKPTTVVAPPALRPPDFTASSFVCPGSGRGWHVFLAWPGDQEGLASYQVEAAIQPGGPWKGTPPWTPGSPARQLGEFAPASKVFLKGKAIGAGGESLESVAMVTAPEGAC